MTLQLYQTLFIIFVSLTIVFAILSVVLFFLFDIRKIIRIKTGADMRQSMRELYDANRGSGGQRKRYKARSVQLFKDTGSGMTGEGRPASSGNTGPGRPDSMGMTGRDRLTGQDRPDSTEMTGRDRLTGQDRPDSMEMTGRGRPDEPGRTAQEAACSREEQVTESFCSDGDRNATTVLTNQPEGKKELYTEQLKDRGAAHADYHFTITETKLVVFSDTIIPDRM